MKNLKFMSLFASAFFSAIAFAQPETILEEVYVTGGKDNIRTLSGSAALIDEQSIKKFDSTDLTALISQVPGVYVRLEDGYGLRPNIGIRGTTSDRSQKLTLMEDGILISPAPYAAPAAYYFPNVNRMDALEVFKGPAAVHHGPHTVGGALNMVTRAIPEDQTRDAKLSLGSDQYYNARVFVGDNFATTGYWVDALAYGAGGFKTLPNGADTGFKRNDLNAKWQWRSSASNPKHKITVKAGYADEVSDETYLGLTDADFADDPYQRYAASALDQFDSKHYQLHVLGQSQFNDRLTLHTKAYVNRFNRDWNKLDGFYAPDAVEGDTFAELTLQQVLAHPDDYPITLAILQGRVDSNGRPEQTLKLTNNGREYGSQGVELTAYYQIDANDWSHKFRTGVRYHEDYVDREHTQQGYLMRGGSLLSDGVSRDLVDDNRSQAGAWAFSFGDEISWQKWKWDIGFRVEAIETDFTDYAVGQSNFETQTIVIPGAGAFYQWSDELGLLVGINKGFSPNSASGLNSSNSEPEESVNIEYGFRYERDSITFDVIGFFSDYENLLGRCRASDSGCSVGQEFNGGAIEISGAEITLNAQPILDNGWIVPISWQYTHTDAHFQSAFRSGFSQWGTVSQGDELPYVPAAQSRLDVGLDTPKMLFNVALRYVGDMRERPGVGFDAETALASYTVIDAAVHYRFNDDTTVKLIAENLTEEQALVARRPFGARPNHPRTVKLGAEFSF